MTFFLIVHSEGKLSPYDFIQGSARSGPITSMTSSLTISPLCILVQPQGFCTCCSHSQDYSWLLRFYSFPSIYSLLKCHLSEAFPGPPSKDYNTLHLTLLTLSSSLFPQSTDHYHHMFYLLITLIVCLFPLECSLCEAISFWLTYSLISPQCLELSLAHSWPGHQVQRHRLYTAQGQGTPCMWEWYLLELCNMSAP